MLANAEICKEVEEEQHGSRKHHQAGLLSFHKILVTRSHPWWRGNVWILTLNTFWYSILVLSCVCVQHGNGIALHSLFSSKILGNKILRYSNLENMRYCQILDQTVYVGLVLVSYLKTQGKENFKISPDTGQFLMISYTYKWIWSV